MQKMIAARFIGPSLQAADESDCSVGILRGFHAHADSFSPLDCLLPQKKAFKDHIPEWRTSGQNGDWMSLFQIHSSNMHAFFRLPPPEVITSTTTTPTPKLNTATFAQRPAVFVRPFLGFHACMGANIRTARPFIPSHSSGYHTAIFLRFGFNVPPGVQVPKRQVIWAQSKILI